MRVIKQVFTLSSTKRRTLEEENRQQERIITDDEFRLIAFSNIVYAAERRHGDQGTPLDRLNYKKDIHAKMYPHLGIDEYKIVECNTSMLAAINDKNKKAVIAVRGSNFHNVKDLYSVVNIASNALFPRNRQAKVDRFIEKFRQKYKDYDLTLTGHSAGGYYTEHNAMKTGLKCESFNTGTPIIPGDLESHPNIKSHSVNLDIIALRAVPGERVQWEREEDIKRHRLKTFIDKYERQQQMILHADYTEDSAQSLLEIKQFKSIVGAYVNPESPVCSLIYTKEKLEETNLLGVDIKDLAVPLYIFYSDEVKFKNIGFSLQDLGDGSHKKVFLPDKFEGRSVIGDTEFGDVLFQAHWLLRQLFLGVEVVSVNPLVMKKRQYSEKLVSAGIKSYITTQERRVVQWNKLGLFVKNIKAKGFKSETDGRFFQLDDVVIGVHTDITPTEEFKVDEKLEYKKMDIFRFMYIPTIDKIYQIIEEEFPIFQRLKKIMQAIALAKWMWLTKVPIDIDKVKAIIDTLKEPKQSPVDIVPSLNLSKQINTQSQQANKDVGGIDLNIDFSEATPENPHGYHLHANVTIQSITLPPELDTIIFPFSCVIRCKKCGNYLMIRELKNSKESTSDNEFQNVCEDCVEQIKKGIPIDSEGPTSFQRLLDMAIIADEHQEEDEVRQNAIFFKEWEFLNSSEIEWPSGLTLKLLQGAVKIYKEPEFPKLKPSEKCKLKIWFRAPFRRSLHYSEFALCNSKGEHIGTKLKVMISVGKEKLLKRKVLNHIHFKKNRFPGEDLKVKENRDSTLDNNSL